MVNDWEKVTLVDHCQKIGSGATPRGGSSVYLEEADIALIRSQNIYNEGFSKDGLVYITVDAAEKLKNVIVEEDDILLNITGDSVARVCMVDNSYLPARVNQHVSIIRPKVESFNAKFLRYYLTSPYMQQLMLNYSSAGATRKALTKSMIENLEVLKPSIDIQNNIAHILSTLDDKIELNLQMNETVEAMAQALFKSWFVDFDPVLDNALLSGKAIPEPLKERAEIRQTQLDSGKAKTNSEINELFPSEFEFTGEFGWIPKGWSVDSLDQLCSTITDGSHSSPKSVDEGYPMASVKDMNNWGFNLDTCRIISETDYLKLKKNGCQPLKNDVLIAKDGSYLKHIFVMEDDLDLVTLSSIAILRPNLRINPHFLKFTLKREDVHRRMENYVSGAVIRRIVLRDFRKFEIVVPPEYLQSHWFELTEGIFESCWNNIHQNETLANLRDTLLPKLMSGELRIPDTEKLVPDA